MAEPDATTAPHLTILTGASRGMGLAMALQRLEAGHRLLSIARTASERLAAHGPACEQWTQDLADPLALAERLEGWLAERTGQTWASVALINNAAVLPAIAPLDAVPAREVAQAMRVDLEAPMLLTAAFLRATRGWRCPRKVLNISSGLGRRAMASQAVYCAAKAGMDHFTRCLALEQARVPGGAQVCSLAPGVIDTEMQGQLRSADAAQFPDIGNFIALKDNGALASPEQAAQRVLAFLDRADFGAQPVADVRD